MTKEEIIYYKVNRPYEASIEVVKADKDTGRCIWVGRKRFRKKPDDDYAASYHATAGEAAERILGYYMNLLKESEKEYEDKKLRYEKTVRDLRIQVLKLMPLDGEFIDLLKLQKSQPYIIKK